MSSKIDLSLSEKFDDIYQKSQLYRDNGETSQLNEGNLENCPKSENFRDISERYSEDRKIEIEKTENEKKEKTEKEREKVKIEKVKQKTVKVKKEKKEKEKEKVSKITKLEMKIMI